MRTAGGYQTKDQALEKLRAAVINAMREGQVLAVYLGDLKYDFSSDWTNKEIFPASTIFDFQKWRKKETYEKFVKQEEMYGPNDTGHGSFFMSSDFSICIISTNTELAVVNNIAESTSNSENMVKITLMESYEPTPKI